MPRTELGNRVAVAAIGIPFGFGVVYLGAWAVAVVLAVVAVLGVREVYRIAEASGSRPFQLLGTIATGALVLSAAFVREFGVWSSWAAVLILALTLVGMAAAVFLRGSEGRPLEAAAITTLGAVYVGLGFAFGVHLRVFPEVGDGGIGWAGGFLVAFPLVVTWIGDSAAYFGGRRWGRRKLIPSVSPGKTIEGGLWGLFGAILAAVAWTAFLLNPIDELGLSLGAAAGVGVLIGMVAQVGDLAESLIKRSAGVKDSGSLLPGHGGVLDRFDSVLFTLPLTYALMMVLLR